MNGIGILSGACKCYVADRFASRQGCFCLFLLVFAADDAPFTCCGSGVVLLPLAAAVSGCYLGPCCWCVGCAAVAGGCCATAGFLGFVFEAWICLQFSVLVFAGADFLVLTQGYACVPSNVYSCVITLPVVFLFLGGFLKGFLFESGDCMATDFPLFVSFFSTRAC
jgi:hypothetical protein